MVELTVDERRALIKILSTVPELATPPGRQQMLELAGLGHLSAHIDLGGATFVAVNQIVSFLAQYGRVSWEHEALGLFLNLVKTLIGMEQQEFLSQLLRRHDMMTPISPGAAVVPRAAGTSTPDIAEKIVTSNTLRPIAFVEQALAASRSVAFINVDDGPDSWSGTGFLISDDLLVTNHHVLPDLAAVRNATFRFNYEDDADGRPRRVADYRAAEPLRCDSDAELDFALVQIDGSPGETWGHLRVSAGVPRVGHRVNIIQHPGGQPKQITLQANFVEYSDDSVVQYVTATLPGSSGSPVLTDDWEVCAVHHAGGRIIEPTSGRYFFRNEGIRLGRILQELPRDVRDRIRAVSDPATSPRPR